MLNWIKSIFAKKTKSAPSRPFWVSLNGQQQSAYDVWNERPAPTPQELLSACDDIIYGAVSIIASKLSSVKLILKRGEEPVTDHAAIDLLFDNNQGLDFYQLLGATQASIDLAGNAFWWIGRANAVPLELVLLPASQVTFNRGDSRILSYIFTRGTHEKTVYRPEEIVHFRSTPNPIDPYGSALSPTHAVWQRLQIARKENSFLEAIIGNATNPAGFLAPEGELISPQECERIEKSWHEKLKTSGNGKTPVFPHPLKYTSLGFPPKDYGQLQLYEAIRKLVLFVFQIPPTIYEMSDSNRASAIAGEQHLAEYCLKPRVRNLVSTINEQLVKRFYGDACLFDFEDFTPRDEDFELLKTNTLLQAIAGGAKVTQDELRERLGLPPLAQDGAALVVAAAPADPLAALMGNRSLPALPAPQKALKALTSVEPTTDPDELVKALRDVFARQREAVLESLVDVDFDKSLPPSVLTSKELTQESWQWKAKPPEAVFDLSSWAEPMFAELSPVIFGYADAASKQMVVELGGSPDLVTVVQPKARKAAEKSLLLFCESTNETTSLVLSDALAKLKEEIGGNVERGETAKALKKKVELIFDNIQGDRAKLIADTEHARCVNVAQTISAKESGLVKKKKWVATTKACPLCKGLEKKGWIGVDDDFVVLGEGPYDTLHQPPGHPGCLLPETPVFAPGAIVAMKASYDGPVVKVKMSSGDSFTCTPNHMFLTPTGFARAESLMKGDDILYCLDGEGMAFVDPNNDRKPTEIQEVVHAFSVAQGMATESVEVAAPHFHGDGALCKGNVDIVRANRLLRDERHGEQVANGELDGANIADLLFPNGGAIAKVLEGLRDATDGGMSGIREAHALLWRRLGHADDLGLVPVSGLDAAPEKMAPYDPTVYAKRLGECQLGFPGKITARQVIDIEIVDSFHGSVYDLTTSSSLYLVSGGAISSNCLCGISFSAEEDD